MNVFILEGNLDKAKEIGNRILYIINTGSMDSNQSSTRNSTNNLSNNNLLTKFEFWNEKENIK